VASRAAKERCDAGFGVNKTGEAVYLDFAFNMKYKYGKIEATKKGISNPTEEQLKALGHEVIKEKYGNLFDMYQQITGVNPYENPMMIYPAVHYTMGGLWVDYNLMTTVPGLYALGEANFSDHGANRLGASALMQGLADGYFVIPYTIGAYLNNEIRTKAISTDHEAFVNAEKAVQDRIDRFFAIKGTKSVDYFHKKLGKIMWDKCGMARNEVGLKEAIEDIKNLRNEFWNDVRVPGAANELNPELEKAGRVADFLELGELMCLDALKRNESCGGHFREEYQTEEGEALRDDENFKYVAAWEMLELGNWELNKEDLIYDNIKIAQRSYK
jgi:succinate dehydrogenase / fumarate reductase flavoprotein subunit